MNEKDKGTIEKIRASVKKQLYNYENKKLHVFTRGGHGRGRFKDCYWIDVRYGENDAYAASILFYEDAIIDCSSGNLHPGRYGYVVFQKWHNFPFARSAPNMKMKVGKCYGVFIPFGDDYRVETGINVLDNNKSPKEIADEVFNSFVDYTENFRTNTYV